MTRSPLATMRLIAVLPTLMLLLSGCAPLDLLKLLAGPPVTRVVTIVECPQLDAPPPAVTDALEATLDDPEAAQWIDRLGKHYDKLDACD